MAIIIKGKTFTATEQVTSTKLHQLVDNATFDAAAADGSTLEVSAGALRVKDAGITGAKLSATVAIPTGATAVTQAADTNTTAVATCAFAKAEADVAQTAAIASSCQRASNLSDVASASTARTNLGLGGAATANSAQVCKAWCNFNGATTGTNAPRAGYNVTSVQRTGAGLYRINFTNAMSSVDYAFVGSARRSNGVFNDPNIVCAPQGAGTYPLTTTYVDIVVGVPSTATPQDYDFVSCVIFGA